MLASPAAVRQQNHSGSRVHTSKAKTITAPDFLVLTRHYRKISPGQMAGSAEPGYFRGAQEQRQRWGRVWCLWQLARGFFTCGQLPWYRQHHVPMVEGTQPPSKQHRKAFEVCATGSRSQPPANGPCHCTTHPLPRLHELARCTEGAGIVSVIVSSKQGREAGNDPLGTS